jgi:hypothetical protein
MTRAKNSFLISLAAISLMSVGCLPGAAQVGGSAAMGQTGSAYSNGTTGFQSNQGTTVGNPYVAPQGQTSATGSQNQGNLAPVGTPGGAAGSPGPTFGLNGTGYAPGSLPPTTLDSFVYNSGYDDTIYGDEGSYGPPPYSDFDTIGSGMGSYGGLTTGHSSSLPSSWGYTSGTY